MSDIYSGSEAELFRTFYNAAGDPTNPTTVTLVVIAPDGSETSLVPTATGFEYAASFTADQPGRWRAVWESAGNGVDHVFSESFEIADPRP